MQHEHLLQNESSCLNVALQAEFLQYTMFPRSPPLLLVAGQFKEAGS
uniref:Uncharacterized protein n=1 Tax=Rhizophora mucronata TaxID=61149 RepID=A0A2P2PU34_RHIMU